MKVFRDGLILSILTITLLGGCATTKGPGVGEVKEEDIKRAIIENIDLKEKDGKDVVKVEASKPLTYTAFKLTDPPRLVIDMPDFALGEIHPMDVQDGRITRIEAREYKEGTMKVARIEIGLEDGSEYEIFLEGSSLQVEVGREGSTAIDVAEPAVEGPSVDTRGVEAGSGVETASMGEEGGDVRGEVSEGPGQVQTTPPRMMETKPSTSRPTAEGSRLETKPSTSQPTAEGSRLETKPSTSQPTAEGSKAMGIVAIDHIGGDTYDLIYLRGDGRIGDYNAFTLDNPNRIVFDLWNVKALFERRALKVDSAFIKDIRIGEDPYKLRVVLDLKGEIPPYRVEKRGEKVYLLLGDIEKALAKMPAKRKVAEAPPASLLGVAAGVSASRPEVERNSVESVDFTEGKRSSLIIIKTSRPAEYSLSRSLDGRSVALLIKDVTIPEDLRRTIDTSELDIGIESFSSYPSPKTPKDVVVLVRLKSEMLPKVKRIDSSIVMEFPKPVPVVARKVEKGMEKRSAEEAKIGRGVKRAELMRATKREQVQTTPEEKRYTGKKISLDVKDADITNIFRLLGEVSKLNIVVPEEVKGKITLRLIDVPWDQALDIILKTKGLGMVREGNVIRIAPVEKIAEEKKRLVEEKKAKEKLEELVVKLIPVNYAKAGDISPKVKDLLSERGSVSVDERTNTLIIKDIPANIEEAETLIKRLDSPTPQVLIEARIVEASRTFARDLGIEWGVDVARGTDKIRQSALFGGLDASGLTPPSNLDLNSRMGTSNFAVSLPASGGAGTLGAVGFMFGKFTNNPVLLDLRLSAGEVEGLSKTISRPKIITLDNKEAKISQGKTIPYQTVSEAGTQTQFIDATLDLTVTPKVTPDGRVLLKIKVSKNSKGEDTAAGPVILKKEASTEILLKDMETAVIGGIVETEKSDSTSGIPWARNIPGLGWLFKKESKSDTQTELLIFITPKILREPS